MKSEAEILANQLSSIANNSMLKKAIIKELMREHRTWKQGIMRFFMEFTEQMAKDDCDLRNEASVQLAKKILEIENRFLPYI
jgi:hypothetical protein